MAKLEPRNVPSDLEIAQNHEMEHIKHNREAQAMELITETMPSIPPVAMAPTRLVGTAFDPTRIAARLPTPVPPSLGPRPPLLGFNFTCTNVPGVQVPQYIAGRKMLRPLAAMMLSGTLGYGVAVGSYNQQLFFNLTADPRLLPDLDAMRETIEACLEELRALAESKTPRAAAG